MGEILEMNRVGTAENFNAQYVLGMPEQHERSGEVEQWRREGFAQIAYFAADYLQFGAIQEGTKLRVSNERAGKALEALGEPFIAEFNYDLINGELVAENGEPLVAMYERSHEQSIEEAKQNPKLAFREKRFGADTTNARLIREMVNAPDVPVGATMLISSACPSAAELGIPELLLKELNYRPEFDQAMVWCAKKTTTGVSFKTLNLFNAPPDLLQATAMSVSGKTLPELDREGLHTQQVMIGPEVEDVASLFRDEFDAILSQEVGFETYHGFNAEYKNKSSETLTTHPHFIAVQESTIEVLDQAAQSLVTKSMKVDRHYLQAMLTMKKPNGEFELQGVRRRSVMKAVNADQLTQHELENVISSVDIASSSALWAVMAKLYYCGVQDKPRYEYGQVLEASSAALAAQSLGVVYEVRSEGQVEGGCPGGIANKLEKSIFDMSEEERVDTLTKKESWTWKKGICRVEGCYTRPGQTEVGPCDVCKSCQKHFDNGKDPTKMYRFIAVAKRNLVVKTVSVGEAPAEKVVA
jgi:hypothetical protein